MTVTRRPRTGEGQVLTVKQLADILEAVEELLFRMEGERPKRHEWMESMRDTRKRVRFLLREAVSRSNSVKGA